MYISLANKIVDLDNDFDMDEVKRVISEPEKKIEDLKNFDKHA